ncbi:MAG TPA: DUF433 domain-containing protein [Isosphaeraceae bacterium]|nr:DUF433 domain-containing protein [Isosphaeraceae bacterium]
MEPTATQTPYRPSELPTDRVRIVSTPGACGGRPRIDGHRATIEDVAIRHERMGMSPDEIVSAYQSLALSGVRAALAYDDEQRERIDAEIRKGERLVAPTNAPAKGGRCPGRFGSTSMKTAIGMIQGLVSI